MDIISCNLTNLNANYNFQVRVKSKGSLNNNFLITFQIEPIKDANY